jgi:hypothetical protein
MTDAWDPSNPEHKAIQHGIEVGDGIPEMRTLTNARNALKSVGFEILHEEDLADRELSLNPADNRRGLPILVLPPRGRPAQGPVFLGS